MEHADDPNVTEFCCADCHRNVFSFGASFVTTPPRCAVCLWLINAAPPGEQRERMRAILTDSLDGALKTIN